MGKRWYDSELRYVRCPEWTPWRYHAATSPPGDPRHLPTGWERGVEAEVAYVIATAFASGTGGDELERLARERARALLARKLARWVCADAITAACNAELRYWLGSWPPGYTSGRRSRTVWRFDEGKLPAAIEHYVLPDRPRREGARTVRLQTHDAARRALTASAC